MTVFRRNLLLLACLALPACGVGEASVSDTEEVSSPVPVRTAFPTRGDIYATYDATTTIASEGDAPVLARVPGDLVELVVEEGEWVSEGQVLARLDGERLRLEMLAARANLEQAEGEYQRNMDLMERGLISEAMFDGLRYELDALRALYDLRRLDYGYAEITATIDGYVSNRSVKLGQHVVTNQETFRITDTTQLIAYLQIPQSELPKFEAGQSASLDVDSMPGRRFPAEIIRISPTIDPRNGTFRATVLIENTGGELAPGMFARFSIAWDRHADALVIPSEALVREDEVASVFVVQDGEVQRRIIETGIESDGHVEVLGGLDESDEIVIVGHGALRDGSKVLARLDNPQLATG